MIRKIKEPAISPRTEGMVDASANYYQESKLFYYMQNAQALEYDRVEANNDDLALQLSPYTATWGLIYWEEAVGLPRRPNEDYEVRRPPVLARLVNAENFSAEMIHRTAANYGEEIRVVIDPVKFLVTVTFKRGVPTFLEDFQEAVESIVHAHYGMEYKFEYIIKGGLIVTTRYDRFLYDVPKAGPTLYCGTCPTIATLGRVYRSGVCMATDVDETITDYKQSGAYASGPLPFVSVEGRVYRSQLALDADGTITVATYKQSGDAVAGTIPSVSTEGMVYKSSVATAADSSATAATYVRAGEIYSGGVKT